VVRTVHITADPTVGTILRTWLEQYLEVLIPCWHNFKNVVRAVLTAADPSFKNVVRAVH